MKDDFFVKWLGEWSIEICLGSAVFRLLLAVFCASVLGFERASKRHSAGLRMFILITTSSFAAAFMDLIINANNTECIPLMSIASVLCAIATSVKSVLFSAKNQIKGLTTSAGLIASAFLGIAIGMGYYLLAFLMFALLLVVLALFPKIEIYLKNRSNHFEIHLELSDKSSLQNFVTTIR